MMINKSDKLNNQERAILIGICKPKPDSSYEYQWAEFTELVKAAGAIEVERVVQVKDNPDPAFFIGSGKAGYLAELVREKNADLVISISELTPVQIRNLEDLVGIRVIDRTDLILAIFARRARSKEGKLQVELAQLNYILPRLGNRNQYSRLGGGIGTRGPGETKLETDKRRIKRRITELRRQLNTVEKHRNIQRHQREKREIPSISLVGYTNAGKSTLFNRLTGSEVSAQDRLFDTLDPVARRVRLPGGPEAVIIDTVGFVSNLPHQLVAAFKATLEETVRASLLLHVMDAGSPYLEQHYIAVQNTLRELNIHTKNVINILNKADLIDDPHLMNRYLKEWSAIPISALNGNGIPQLLAVIGRQLHPANLYHIFLPFTEAGLLNLLHREAMVLEEVFTGEGIRLLIETDTGIIGKYRKYLISEGSTC